MCSTAAPSSGHTLHPPCIMGVMAETQGANEDKAELKSPRMMTAFSQTLLMALATLATALLGATMRGDWIILLVHFWKQAETPTSKAEDDNITSSTAPGDSLNDVILSQGSRFANVHWFVILSLSVSFVSYFGLGGFLQWHYYIKQKDNAEEWKCQPKRWLTRDNERHEIALGSLNMAIGGTVSGIIACYILNGGYTTMYYSAGERGWLYLLLSTALVFLYQDAGAYYIHRLSHIPAIYKPIHKHHHRYHSPTAFSATAMHPAEFIVYQSLMASPIFFMPIYSGAFVFLLFYGYYYGMIDHSGIKMDALWPWQPETLFHDDHHKYFHTNFGFNTKLWDWMHDTLRQNTRVYGEDIFYGKGKPKDQ